MIDVADSNTVYYYHFDGLGSVIALSDQNADLVESYSYDVFGKPSNTSDVNNPYLFTGRRYDDETGLYYYRARYYDYATGRFLQSDPLLYNDGLNLYSYVGNNPVNLVDPLGLQLIENIKVFGNEKAVNEAIEYLLKSTTFAQAYEAFENSGKILKIKTITIKCKTDEMNMIYRWTEGTIYWDPSLASVFDTFNLELGSSWDDPIILGSQSPAMILAHEILHAIQHLTNPENINPFTHDPVTKLPTDPQYGNPEDRRVITGPEADIACDLGEDIRSSNRATFFKAASITSNELPKLPKLYPD